MIRVATIATLARIILFREAIMISRYPLVALVTGGDIDPASVRHVTDVRDPTPRQALRSRKYPTSLIMPRQYGCRSKNAEFWPHSATVRHPREHASLGTRVVAGNWALFCGAHGEAAGTVGSGNPARCLHGEAR